MNATLTFVGETLNPRFGIPCEQYVLGLMNPAYSFGGILSILQNIFGVEWDPYFRKEEKQKAVHIWSEGMEMMTVLRTVDFVWDKPYNDAKLVFFKDGLSYDVGGVIVLDRLAQYIAESKELPNRTPDQANLSIPFGMLRGYKEIEAPDETQDDGDNETLKDYQKVQTDVNLAWRDFSENIPHYVVSIGCDEDNHYSVSSALILDRVNNPDEDPDLPEDYIPGEMFHIWHQGREVGTIWCDNINMRHDFVATPINQYARPFREMSNAIEYILDGMVW